MTVWFFGCRRIYGHCFWDPSGIGKLRDSQALLGPEGIPWRTVDGALTPKDLMHQGAWALRHHQGWTALAFHDYTIDSRPKSNSVFISDEILSWIEIVKAAAPAFPDVVERLDLTKYIQKEEKY